MTSSALYTKDTRIWVPHPKLVWESATVVADYRAGVLLVKTDKDQQPRQIQIKDEKDLPPLQNPDMLLGLNDLTALSYLHEAAVLHNLKIRFHEKNAIYTYCGIVLVAINPYHEIPIYGEETIMAYRGHSMGSLDPHIFAIAEEVLTKLNQEEKSQSIIVSGVSGAGKTVNAKYAMRYFASVAGKARDTQVERKVLATNPIMEAIGNAKTTRNDNSSRFGKLIEIHLDHSLQITGVSMRTYLLEKSKVVYQSMDERNYHIFYQMCAARAKLPGLFLDHQDTFRYLNQGGCPDIDGVDDLKSFHETCNALTTLGVTEKEQSNLFTLLAIILHLGNIEMTGEVDDGDDRAFIHPNDKHLEYASRLLGLDTVEVAHWLTHRRLVTAHERVVSRMDRARAIFARDALAKHMYGEAFAWLVAALNRNLSSERHQHNIIAVLDIYGFETFELNSFEQFCINYANEKLQQQFNLHVFKLQQEEYIKEGISWSMIEFYDNQPCIDLIEGRLGVLDYLDEECRVPQGSDQGFVDKLLRNCSRSPGFSKPRFGNEAFIINHFVDKVEYQAGGFVDKNRDSVHEEQLELLRASAINRPSPAIFQRNSETEQLSASATLPAKRRPTVATSFTHTLPRRSLEGKQTVGSQFRGSLAALMATLSATTPHYVRCVKPNDTKASFQFDNARTVHQLRACGVLETVRISAAGFPSRWTYQDFITRYRVLAKQSDVDPADVRATCQAILRRHVKGTDLYQYGHTKIFFRAGQVAYLEKVRADTRRAYCVVVQACVRRFVARRRYQRIRRAVLLLQAHARGMLARRRVLAMRRERAAIVVQRHVRGWLARRRLAARRALASGLGAHARGWLLRRRLHRERETRAAITIQRHVRGFLARKHYADTLRKIITVQSTVRGFLARRQCKKLRIKARSLDHVKKLNKGLENKIISLQHRLQDALERAKLIEPLQKQISDLKTKYEALKPIEIEVKTLKEELVSKNNVVADTQKTLESIKATNARLVLEKEELEQSYTRDRRLWEEEKEKVVEKFRLEAAHYEMQIEECGKRHEAERSALRAELEEERQRSQGLLSAQHELQERVESLMAPNVKAHHRSPSNSSAASHRGSALPTNEDDFENGSVVSVEATQPALEAVNWSAGSTNGHTPTVDVGLVLRMRTRNSMLQSELSRALKRVADYEDRYLKILSAWPTNPGVDRFKLEELEIENKKLREAAERVRVSADVPAELAGQLDTMQSELDRRGDEIVQLKSVLANQPKPWLAALKKVTGNLKSLASNYGPDDVVNEDGEVATAYQTQKNINRQLHEELTIAKKHYNDHISELQKINQGLIEEIEKYQKMLSADIGAGDKSKSEEFIQYELAKIQNENPELQERVNKLSTSVRRYHRQVAALYAKLSQLGVEDISTLLDDSALTGMTAGAVSSAGGSGDAMVARKREREYLGMIDFQYNDISKILNKLIKNLKPRTALELLPCLPAYILIMMMRRTDEQDDEARLHQLLRGVRASVRKTLVRHTDSFDHKALWLANMLRLLNNTRQYSGDVRYQSDNTPRQNQQCLRVFDLSEYRQVLSDTAVWIYQELVKLLQSQLQRLIVPAVLEHEEISELPRPARPAGSDTPTAGAEAPGPERLKADLAAALCQLLAYSVEPHIIIAIFKQLFYFICAFSLNQLLLRKDLCCWSKGLQIRYNISHIETWAKETFSVYGQTYVEEVVAQLRPITQAVQLLQARKSMADVQSTVDMCPDLTALQVCKILNMYTTLEEYEVKVTREFICEIQKKMQENAGPDNDKKSRTLLKDVQVIFSVQFPFTPSPIRLEDVEIPDVLGLQDLLVKL